MDLLEYERFTPMNDSVMNGFGSDNHAPTHPEILHAINQANQGHAPSYGTCEYTRKATQAFEKQFGPCQVSFVFNGTGANILALRAMTKPGQAIICSETAHIHVDECAGPEILTGCKLWPLKHSEGKISLHDLKQSIIRRGDQHFAQQKVLSLTQPTELGTLYSLKDLKELIQFAKSQNILIHMDGARIANAVTALGTSFAEMTTELGVDMVSFGGTKNGFLFGEAVVCLNPKLYEDMQYLRKQMAQLPSKTRYIAAQFSRYFENDLWKNIATHSIAMAKLMHDQIKDIPGIKITAFVQTNSVFVQIPKNWIKELRKRHFFYVWDEQTFECRLMMSWDNTPEEIMDFASQLRDLSKLL